MCVPKSAGFVRTPPIAQWGGCRPPHPPRDRDQAVLVCTVLSRRRRNDCHDKALGDSTVVLAPLNGPRVPSPSLTLYRRPRTTGLPTESTPALSRTRPALPWRPLYRVPEISCRPCRPTKNFVLPCFDDLTAMPQGPDEAALAAEAELSAVLRGPEPILRNSSSVLCS